MPRNIQTPYLLMVLMLGLLAGIAPATIDAYLPAFGALEQEFGVTPEAVQRTLGVYTSAYAAMLLVHGTLSDCFGRRRIILVALGLYLAGTLMAALAPGFGWLLAGRTLQGLAAGAGLVVGEAIVRDCYDDEVARRTLSYIVMVFNVSPALAPIVGGYLVVAQGWRAVFFVLAVVALSTLMLCAARLPETLPSVRRQPLAWRALFADAQDLLRDPHYRGMTLAASLLVASQAFLIGSAPDFVGHVLGLPETALAVLFLPLVAGAMAGALLAARLPSRWASTWTIPGAYTLMAGGSLANVFYLASAPTPALPWAVVLPAFFTGGLAMVMPALTLRALARAPSRAGMAASLLGFSQMMAFSLVAGWCVPLIYGRPLRMALIMLACTGVSMTLWMWMRLRTPARPV
ncbi:Multidrug resistance transporter, Bcr/CflA family [plant metagenome]|uniref:Multidrug resistance transporter, Bcr/CflA family n=1 Tax=plant metagenome TaxID=1297885 RepID=A0A484P205_9ZZZZ